MATGSTRAVMAAMIANAVIAAAKFTAATITGSSAMFSEGIHSVADTGNQALLLFGNRRSQRPADSRHPFGYGQEMYFWSLIVAIILFALGGGVSLYEGINHLGHPEVPGDPLWNYSILVVAFAVEMVALRVALGELRRRGGTGSFWRRLKESTDPRVFVPITEDMAALLGIVVAFAGIMLSRRLGDPVYDALASIVIGVILACVAVFLAYETRALLVGEAIGPELEEEVRRVCREDEAVADLVRLLGIHLGPDEVLLTLELRFAPGVEDSMARVVDRLERRLREADSRIRRVFVEPEEAGEGISLSPPF